MLRNGVLLLHPHCVAEVQEQELCLSCVELCHVREQPIRVVSCERTANQTKARLMSAKW